MDLGKWTFWQQRLLGLKLSKQLKKIYYYLFAIQGAFGLSLFRKQAAWHALSDLADNYLQVS